MASPRIATKSTSWIPVLVALAVVAQWGATPVFTKLAAREIDPLVVGIMRTLLGGLAAAPLALTLRIRPPRQGRQLWPLLLSGFCGFVAFPILYTIGQRMTSAMHGGLILAALPIFTGLYAAAFERRRPNPVWWAGCAVAFAGEILLILGRMPASAGEASVAGDLLILFASLFAAMGYVAGARLTQSGYASLGTTLWGVTAASIAVAPLLPLVTGGAMLPEASWVAWGAIATLAWVTSIMGYIGWYWALGHGGIARMGTIQFLQPLSGLVLAFFWLGERPTMVLIAATVMIFAGVVIARRR
jgi:drug/metabolite transporter (DMT)-like permease